MPFGYNGKILYVDLTHRKVEIKEPGEKWYRTYMGGTGIIGETLLKEIKPDIDPLGPENVMVFTTSVVTGAPISGFNRFSVGAKSPLTGGFAESEAAGYFGPELKFAGFDAVIIKGAADAPVYLWINDGEVEIRDAADLWGMDNAETLTALEEATDKKVRVCGIGPAGENLVSYAALQNDIEHFNGRTGMGAVMGSKKLKAIAVRGTGKLEFANPEKVKEIAKWHREKVKVHPPNVGLTKYGTPGLTEGVNAGGFLPTRNWKEGQFEGWKTLAAEHYHETIFAGRGTCWMCSVACKRRVESDAPYPLNKKYGGPEFESIGALGSMCAIADIAAVARGHQLCNLLGLDVVSTGAVVAFAMECFENGILTAEDFEGRSIGFGDAAGMLWLIEKIASREGIGETLSLGVKRAAEKIGNGAEKYAMHVKGQEPAFHDGRGKSGMAMGFALSPTGADHIETPHDHAFMGDGVAKLFPLGLLDPVEPLKTDAAKVRFFYIGQKAWGINNLLGLCNFCSVPIHAMTFPRLVEAVEAITGWESSLFEIVTAVERGNVMARIFNNRCGFTPADDKLIERWYEKMPAGPLKDVAFDRESFADCIQLYYEMSGWDKEGRPTRGKLAELGLFWLPEAE